MDPDLLVAAIAVFLIAIVFSMFGQGGGLLYAPTLILLGFATVVSTTTSLVLVLLTACFAAIIYLRRRLVDLHLGAVFAPPIVVGAFLGGVWGNSIDRIVLLWIFVAVLLGAGARMVMSAWEAGPATPSAPRRLTPPMVGVVVLFALGVGVLSAVLGIGGGVLILPFLVIAFRVPTKIAAGTSSFIIIFSSLFGLVGHSAQGLYHHFDVDLILLASVAVAAGALLGPHLLVRTNSRWVKVGFGGLLWGFAVELVLKLVGS